MEGYGHDPVGGVESLLYPVAVMDVDVNIQNSLMVPDKISKQKLVIFVSKGWRRRVSVSFE